MPTSDTSPLLPAVLVTLLRGTIDRQTDPRRWNDLMDLHAAVRDHLGLLGLDLVLNDAEGYAFARQRQPDPDDPDAIPRLVRRRPLSFDVSLMLALIRKRFAEHEASSGERLIISTQQMAERYQVFLPETNDERKLLRETRRPLREIADLGFIRQLKDREDEFEVLRLLKAYVDAQWLNEFDQRLEQYLQHAATKQAGDAS